MGMNIRDSNVSPWVIHRIESFQQISGEKMRYVHPAPENQTHGLVKRVYEMVDEEFFINGLISGQSKVPEILAGMWLGCREVVLVSDKLDRGTKQAMGATLSRFNECQYCVDILTALLHGYGDHSTASAILSGDYERIPDMAVRERCEWIKEPNVAPKNHEKSLFSDEELPEAIGTILVFSYINRFSHVIMDGSPVTTPFGIPSMKDAELRMFGFELRRKVPQVLEGGRAIFLLPPAQLPDGLNWAGSNARIAEAVSRWAAVVERQTSEIVSPAVSETLMRSLGNWQGERMPIGRNWVDKEVAHLQGDDRVAARFMLVAAKAPNQVSGSLAETVLGTNHDEERFIRLLARTSFAAARRLATIFQKDSVVLKS